MSRRRSLHASLTATSSSCAASTTRRAIAASRAAQGLATGQPSIRNHTKQLERVLGASLFHRQRRGVELTPAGRVLLELAGPLVEALDRLPYELAERTAALALREVWIAAGQELLLHLLAPLIQSLRRENPAVRLGVYARVRSETQAMVADGRQGGDRLRGGRPVR